MGLELTHPGVRNPGPVQSAAPYIDGGAFRSNGNAAPAYLSVLSSATSPRRSASLGVDDTEAADSPPEVGSAASSRWVRPSRNLQPENGAVAAITIEGTKRA